MIKRIARRVVQKAWFSPLVNKYLQSDRFSKKSIMSVDLARQIVDEIAPKPKGHAIWCSDNKPHWERSNVDLSIIIPFYNTERYARQCIDSVLNQKCDFSFEVILVDDGSPDGCGVLIDKYSNYGNVVIIHQNNQGLSVARNNGIKIAQGKYIMFLDSDDYLPEDTIRNLVKTANKYHADIVEGSFVTISEQGKIKKEYKHAFSVDTGGRGMFGYACGKVYLRELFSRFCFPAGFWYEDTIIQALVSPQACVTVTIPDVVYFYRINSKGITAQGKKNPKCIDTYHVIEEVIDTYTNLQMDIVKLANGILWQLGPYLLSRLSGIEEQYMEAVFILASELISSNREIVNYPFKTDMERHLLDSLVNRKFDKWKAVSSLM